MRIKPNGRVKRFAFVTVEAYEQIEFIKSRWPQTVNVNDNYKVVNYLLDEESNLKAFTKSLGFEVKELGVVGTIDAINKGEQGPFICGHADALEVINNYSGEMV